MHSLFLAAFISLFYLIVAFDSFTVDETNSDPVLSNPEPLLFSDSEGTSIASSDIFSGSDFDPINPNTDLANSGDSNTIWNDETFPMDATLQASCGTTADGSILKARGGESCSPPQAEFQLPSNLQQFNQDPLGLLQNNLLPTTGNRRETGKGQVHELTPELLEQVQRGKKIMPIKDDEVCMSDYFIYNVCCDGPAYYPDEWPIITEFSDSLDYGHVEKCHISTSN